MLNNKTQENVSFQHVTVYAMTDTHIKNTEA